MGTTKPPAPPPVGNSDGPKDENGRKTPADENATKIPPADRKIGEAPGHLRDREDAFKRRRGGSD